MIAVYQIPLQVSYRFFKNSGKDLLYNYPEMRILFPLEIKIFLGVSDKR